MGQVGFTESEDHREAAMSNTYAPIAWAVIPFLVLLVLFLIAVWALYQQRQMIYKLRAHKEQLKLDKQRLIDSAERDGEKIAKLSRELSESEAMLLKISDDNIARLALEISDSFIPPKSE